MPSNISNPIGYSNIFKYTVLITFSWTLMLGGLLVQNVIHYRSVTLEIARGQTRTLTGQDRAKSWIEKFRDVDHETPLNPYQSENVQEGPNESVSVAKIQALTDDQLANTWQSYCAIWVIGLAGIGAANLRVKMRVAQYNKVQDALRETDEKYRTLYEQSRDAMMVLSPPDWRFVSANKATLRLFGAKEEQAFVGVGPQDVSPVMQPDGQLSCDKARAMIERAMQQGSHYFEWQHKTLSGQEFLTTVLLSRIEIQGEPGIQATVRDITHRRLAEEQGRQESAKLAAMISSMEEGVVFADASDTIVELNPYFARFATVRERTL